MGTGFDCCLFNRKEGFCYNQIRQEGGLRHRESTPYGSLPSLNILCWMLAGGSPARPSPSEGQGLASPWGVSLLCHSLLWLWPWSKARILDAVSQDWGKWPNIFCLSVGSVSELSPTIKCIVLTVQSSGFYIVTDLYNHHHCLVPEFFIISKGNPIPTNQSLPSPLPPGNNKFTLCLYGFASSGYYILTESNNMWLFVTGLFHFA